MKQAVENDVDEFAVYIYLNLMFLFVIFLKKNFKMLEQGWALEDNIERNRTGGGSHHHHQQHRNKHVRYF